MRIVVKTNCRMLTQYRELSKPARVDSRDLLIQKETAETELRQAERLNCSPRPQNRRLKTSVNIFVTKNQQWGKQPVYIVKLILFWNPAVYTQHSSLDCPRQNLLFPLHQNSGSFKGWINKNENVNTLRCTTRTGSAYYKGKKRTHSWSFRD